MSKYLPSNTDTLRNFIYEKEIVDINITFQNSNEQIPLITYVEKETDNNIGFTWYYLIVQVSVPNGGKVKVSLNHPHDPLGVTTFDNMKFVAETCLESIIPELLKKNYDIIKEYLSQNN